MAEILKKFFPILILLLLAILFFFPFLTGESIPYVGDFTGSDLTELNLPFRYLAAESFKQGQVPLWTDQLSAGLPLLAEGQSGVFYPFNVIIFLLLPFSLAVVASLIVNFFLGGLFSYFYCRVLKISQAGALLAAVAFSFSGFFVFRFKHLNYINAAIWLPLEFYLIEKYFSSKRKPLVLLILSLVFSVQFFAGSPPFFYVAGGSAFLYFLFKLIFRQPLTVKRTIYELILPWFLIGLIVFGLIAVQLLPTFFYSALSSRSLRVDYSQAIDFPYSAISLLNFVAPYFLGNPALNTYPVDIHRFGVFWENNIYFGLLPLLLSLLAIIFLFPKKPMVKILTILLLISFLFIFGDFSPVFIVFWKLLPGLQLFRFSQRFLLLALVSLTTLAGFGFDFIFAWLKQLAQKFKLLAKSKMLFKFLLPLFAVSAVVTDLFIVSFGYIGSLDYQQYFSPPKSVEFLKQDSDIFRIYSVAWPEVWHSAKVLGDGWQNNLSFFISTRELLPPNLNVFWGIASAQDRGSLEGGLLVREMQQFNNRLMQESWLKPGNENPVVIPEQVLKIFGLQNVKYLLSFEELSNDRLILVKEIKQDFLPALKIYQNQNFLPLAFAAFEPKIVKDNEAALAAMFEPGFNPAEQIILSPSAATLPVSTSTPLASVEIINNQAGRISVATDFSQAGYLFLSQTFMPGWQAKINGRPAKVLPADYAFMAVVVPPGQSEIEFFFQPLSYLIGKRLTLISIFIFLLCLVYYFFKVPKASTNKLPN